MPTVRIQDNMQLPANTYVIRVKEIEAGRGELRPAMLLAMDPRGEPIALPGETTTRADLRPAGAVDRRRRTARRRCSAASPWSIRRPWSPRT